MSFNRTSQDQSFKNRHGEILERLENLSLEILSEKNMEAFEQIKDEVSNQVTNFSDSEEISSETMKQSLDTFEERVGFLKQLIEIRNNVKKINKHYPDKTPKNTGVLKAIEKLIVIENLDPIIVEGMLMTQSTTINNTLSDAIKTGKEKLKYLKTFLNNHGSIHKDAALHLQYFIDQYPQGAEDLNEETINYSIKEHFYQLYYLIKQSSITSGTTKTINESLQQIANVFGPNDLTLEKAEKNADYLTQRQQLKESYNNLKNFFRNNKQFRNKEKELDSKFLQMNEAFVEYEEIIMEQTVKDFEANLKEIKIAVESDLSKLTTLKNQIINLPPTKAQESTLECLDFFIQNYGTDLTTDDRGKQDKYNKLEVQIKHLAKEKGNDFSNKNEVFTIIRADFGLKIAHPHPSLIELKIILEGIPANQEILNSLEQIINASRKSNKVPNSKKDYQKIIAYIENLDNYVLTEENQLQITESFKKLDEITETNYSQARKIIQLKNNLPPIKNDPLQWFIDNVNLNGPFSNLEMQDKYDEIYQALRKIRNAGLLLNDDHLIFLAKVKLEIKKNYPHEKILPNDDEILFGWEKGLNEYYSLCHFDEERNKINASHDTVEEKINKLQALKIKVDSINIEDENRSKFANDVTTLIQTDIDNFNLAVYSTECLKKIDQLKDKFTDVSVISRYFKITEQEITKLITSPQTETIAEKEIRMLSLTKLLGEANIRLDLLQIINTHETELNHSQFHSSSKEMFNKKLIQIKKAISGTILKEDFSDTDINTQINTYQTELSDHIRVLLTQENISDLINELTLEIRKSPADKVIDGENWNNLITQQRTVTEEANPVIRIKEELENHSKQFSLNEFNNYSAKIITFKENLNLLKYQNIHLEQLSTYRNQFDELNYKSSHHPQIHSFSTLKFDLDAYETAIVNGNKKISTSLSETIFNNIPKLTLKVNFLDRVNNVREKLQAIEEKGPHHHTIVSSKRELTSKLNTLAKKIADSTLRKEQLELSIAEANESLLQISDRIDEVDNILEAGKEVLSVLIESIPIDNQNAPIARAHLRFLIEHYNDPDPNLTGQIKDRFYKFYYLATTKLSMQLTDSQLEQIENAFFAVGITTEKAKTYCECALMLENAKNKVTALQNSYPNDPRLPFELDKILPSLKSMEQLFESSNEDIADKKSKMEQELSKFNYQFTTSEGQLEIYLKDLKSLKTQIETLPIETRGKALDLLDLYINNYTLDLATNYHHTVLNPNTFDKFNAYLTRLTKDNPNTFPKKLVQGALAAIQANYRLSSIADPILIELKIILETFPNNENMLNPLQNIIEASRNKAITEGNKEDYKNLILAGENILDNPDLTPENKSRIREALTKLDNLTETNYSHVFNLIQLKSKLAALPIENENKNTILSTLQWFIDNTDQHKDALFIAEAQIKYDALNNALQTYPNLVDAINDSHLTLLAKVQIQIENNFSIKKNLPIAPTPVAIWEQTLEKKKMQLLRNSIANFLNSNTSIKEEEDFISNINPRCDFYLSNHDRLDIAIDDLTDLTVDKALVTAKTLCNPTRVNDEKNLTEKKKMDVILDNLLRKKPNDENLQKFSNQIKIPFILEEVNSLVVYFQNNYRKKSSHIVKFLQDIPAEFEKLMTAEITSRERVVQLFNKIDEVTYYLGLLKEIVSYTKDLAGSAELKNFPEQEQKLKEILNKSVANLNIQFKKVLSKPAEKISFRFARFISQEMKQALLDEGLQQIKEEATQPHAEFSEHLDAVRVEARKEALNTLKTEVETEINKISATQRKITNPGKLLTLAEYTQNLHGAQNLKNLTVELKNQNLLLEKLKNTRQKLDGLMLRYENHEYLDTKPLNFQTIQTLIDQYEEAIIASLFIPQPSIDSIYIELDTKIQELSNLLDTNDTFFNRLTKKYDAANNIYLSIKGFLNQTTKNFLDETKSANFKCLQKGNVISAPLPDAFLQTEKELNKFSSRIELLNILTTNRKKLQTIHTHNQIVQPITNLIQVAMTHLDELETRIIENDISEKELRKIKFDLETEDRTTQHNLDQVRLEIDRRKDALQDLLNQIPNVPANQPARDDLQYLIEKYYSWELQDETNIDAKKAFELRVNRVCDLVINKLDIPQEQSAPALDYLFDAFGTFGATPARAEEYGKRIVHTGTLEKAQNRFAQFEAAYRNSKNLRDNRYNGFRFRDQLTSIQRDLTLDLDRHCENAPLNIPRRLENFNTQLESTHRAAKANRQKLLVLERRIKAVPPSQNRVDALRLITIFIDGYGLNPADPNPPHGKINPTQDHFDKLNAMIERLNFKNNTTRISFEIKNPAFKEIMNTYGMGTYGITQAADNKLINLKLILESIPGTSQNIIDALQTLINADRNKVALPANAKFIYRDIIVWMEENSDKISNADHVMIDEAFKKLDQLTNTNYSTNRRGIHKAKSIIQLQAFLIDVMPDGPDKDKTLRELQWFIDHPIRNTNNVMAAQENYDNFNEALRDYQIKNKDEINRLREHRKQQFVNFLNNARAHIQTQFPVKRYIPLTVSEFNSYGLRDREKEKHRQESHDLLKNLSFYEKKIIRLLVKTSKARYSVQDHIELRDSSEAEDNKIFIRDANIKLNALKADLREQLKSLLKRPELNRAKCIEKTRQIERVKNASLKLQEIIEHLNSLGDPEQEKGLKIVYGQLQRVPDKQAKKTAINTFTGGTVPPPGNQVPGIGVTYSNSTAYPISSAQFDEYYVADKVTGGGDTFKIATEFTHNPELKRLSLDFTFSPNMQQTTFLTQQVEVKTGIFSKEQVEIASTELMILAFEKLKTLRALCKTEKIVIYGQGMNPMFIAALYYICLYKQWPVDIKGGLFVEKDQKTTKNQLLAYETVILETNKAAKAQGTPLPFEENYDTVTPQNQKILDDRTKGPNLQQTGPNLRMNRTGEG